MLTTVRNFQAAEGQSVDFGTSRSFHCGRELDSRLRGRGKRPRRWIQVIRRYARHPQPLCAWVLGLALTMWATSASAKWYVVVGTLPNNIEVVDTTTDKVVKTIALEGQGPVLAIATNPAAPRYAYATTNLDQAVAVVD